MKKKDLIATIKQTALNEMPDVKNRIDITKIRIEPKPETVKSPFNFRKAVSVTFASLFILISGIFVFNFVNIGTNVTPLESDTEIVGFQTVSAAALLDSFNVSELALTDESNDVVELATTSVTTEDSSDDIINQIKLINHYLNMAETVLGNKNQYLYQTIESDMEAYEYAFQYNGTDMNGNLITYKGYYNIVENGEVQTEQGILIHDGVTFHYSSSTIQNEGANLYRYRIRTTETNYVEVTNQSTASVQRFQYRVYRDDQLANTSTLTVTSKQNGLRANLNIQNQQGNQISLELKRDMSDTANQQFQVQYALTTDAGQTNGEFKVGLKYDEATQTYRYQYNIDNRDVVIEARENKGNQKAKDDDFTPGNSTHSPFVTTTQSDSDDQTTTTQRGSGNATNTQGQNGNGPQTTNSPDDHPGNNPNQSGSSI